MGKKGERSIKSTIAKDKLCDGDFDKLVIDTSRRITQKSCSLDLPASPRSSERYTQSAGPQQQTTLADDDPRNKSSTEYNRLNQPKRPMNAFMVWGQAIRRELHHRFSNVQNALLSKALGRVWRSLDAAEKEPYLIKANLIKANHKRDYPNYRYQPRRVQERRTRGNMLIGINLNHPVNQHPRQMNFNMDQTFVQTNYQAAQGFPCVGGDSETTKDIKQIDRVQTFEYQQAEFTYPSYHQITYNMQHQHYQHHLQQQQQQTLSYEVPQTTTYMENPELQTTSNNGSYYSTINATPGVDHDKVQHETRIRHNQFLRTHEITCNHLGFSNHVV